MAGDMASAARNFVWATRGVVVVFASSLLILGACSRQPSPPVYTDANGLAKTACPRPRGRTLVQVPDAYVGGGGGTPPSPPFSLEAGQYLIAAGIGPYIPQPDVPLGVRLEDGQLETPKPGSWSPPPSLTVSINLTDESGKNVSPIVNDEVRSTDRGFTACRRMELQSGEYRIAPDVKAQWAVIVYKLS